MDTEDRYRSLGTKELTELRAAFAADWLSASRRADRRFIRGRMKLIDAILSEREEATTDGTAPPRER